MHDSLSICPALTFVLAAAALAQKVRMLQD